MSSLEKKVSKNITAIIKKHEINDGIFAVGVSGGADSLALIYLLKPWAKNNNIKLVALTVEHGLRAESRSEAEYVAELMRDEKIEHHILEWSGHKPKSGVEEAARIARYSLMEDFCLKNHIKYLIIAHHKRDQAETFLMRLQRGSGLDGLSAMAEVSTLGSLKVIRPLLDINPEELKSWLSENKIVWKEDASNFDESYLRVKIRNLIPYLEEKIGLSSERLATTAKVLRRTKDYIDRQVKSFVKNNVKFYNSKTAKVSLSLLKNQHEEMVFRILSNLLKEVACRTYIPRAEDVQRLCDNICLGKFKGATLGGCELIVDMQSLWIIPEIKDSNVISKKSWTEFLLQNPKYAGIKFPHKVRKYLYIAK